MSYLQKIYTAERAYKRSRVITTAIHLGILTALKGSNQGLSLDDLQKVLGFSPPWLRSVINVLLFEGLIHREHGIYYLSCIGEEAESDPALRAFSGYHFHCFESWLHLPNALRTGEAGNFHRRRLGNVDFCRAYLESMDAIAQTHMQFLKTACTPYLRSCVLDVGAGPSSLCRELASLDSGMSVTAVDYPEIVSLARETYTAPPNFQWLPGDFLALDAKKPFDAVYCGHVIEYCPETDLASWLGRIRTFLREGGHLVLLLFMQPEIGDESEDLDLFELSTGLNGPQLGHIARKSEIMDALALSGYRDLNVTPIPQGPTYTEYLITCASDSRQGDEEK